MKIIRIKVNIAQFCEFNLIIFIFIVVVCNYLASFGELLESLDGVPEVGARPESHIDALALVEVERERILRLADRPADDGAASDGEEHVFVSAVDGDHAQLGYAEEDVLVERILLIVYAARVSHDGAGEPQQAIRPRRVVDLVGGRLCGQVLVGGD